MTFHEFCCWVLQEFYFFPIKKILLCGVITLNLERFRNKGEKNSLVTLQIILGCLSIS